MYILKIKKFSLINVAICGVTLILYILPYPEIIDHLIYFSLLYQIIAIYHFNKTHGLFHLITIFNSIFFLFYSTKGLLHILDIIHFSEVFKFFQIHINPINQYYLALIPLVVVSLVNTTVLFTNKINYKSRTRQLSILQPAIRIFWLSLPLTFYRGFIQFKHIVVNGYLSLYDGSMKGIDFNLFITLSSYLTEFSFAAIVASNPSKKQFIRYSILFLLIKLLDLLGGRRGQFFTLLVFIVWFYNKTYSKIRVNIITALLSFISIIFIVFIRNYDNFSSIAENEVILKTIFGEFTNTHLILGYLLHFGYQTIHPSPLLILGAPLQFIPFNGQTLEYLKSTFGLGHHLTYYLSSNSYFNGEGIGSSFVAELFSLGIIGLILGSLLLGYIINFYTNRELGFVPRLLTYYVVTHIIFISRTSFLPPILKPTLFLLIYIPMLYLIKKILWQRT